MRQLRAVKNCLPESLRTTLVHCFVSSRLDYGNSLFYGIAENQLDRIQRIQNAAARLITGNRKSCHITSIMRKLHWLPIRMRIDFKIATIVYKCQHGDAPQYLVECLTPHSQDTRQLRSSSYNQLRIPRARTRTGETDFHVSGPTVWNDLPQPLRDTNQSILTFRKNLKTYLFAKTFN